MTVGSNLRRLRLERGLHQHVLAKRANSSQQTISEIEHGKRDPKESTLERLADALGVPMTAFFAEDGPPKAPRPPRTPLTDEKPEVFDKRFRATDLAGAEILRSKLEAELGAIGGYIGRLKEAGIDN